MTKFYTGVGSRKTPADILNIMQKLAVKLCTDGWVLRSGGATGADSAFEKGVIIEGRMQIYHANMATSAAMEIASKFHPAWNRCSSFVRKLHGRNAFQVLGEKLNSPSKFLICWTEDGCLSHRNRSFSTGGTGTAISIADNYGVEVLNLAHNAHLERARIFLNK
jgi:hypothetical protein